MHFSKQQSLAKQITENQTTNLYASERMITSPPTISWDLEYCGYSSMSVIRPTTNLGGIYSIRYNKWWLCIQ